MHLSFNRAGLIFAVFILGSLLIQVAGLPEQAAAEPNTLAITGQISGPSGPVSGVWIKVNTPSGELDDTTDSSGNYSISVPGNGGDWISFNLRPQLADRLAQVNMSMAAPGTAFVQDFSLVAGHLLDIHVPSADGNMYFEIYPLITPADNTWWELDYDAGPGNWRAVLPYDAYHVITFNEPQGRFKTTATYDLRTADQIDTLPLLTSWVSPNPLSPPDPDKITFGPLNDLGETTITGAPGAALPLAEVLLVNLKSTHQAVVHSEADGSFSAQLFAPPGSDISVRHGPPHWRWYGAEVIGANEGLNFYPATILHRPHTHTGSSPNQIPFASVGGIALDLAEPFHIGAAWSLTGTLDILGGMTPGGDFLIDSEIIIYGHNIDAMTDVNAINIPAYLDIFMLYDEDREPLMANNYSGSSRLSTTGFPILDERFSRVYLGETTVGGLTYIGNNRLRGTLNIDAALPIDFPEGIFRPAIWLDFQGVPTSTNWPAAKVDTFTFAEVQAPLPVVEVYNTPPPSPTPVGNLPLVMRLLMNDISLGQRGTGAIEDQDIFGAASFIVNQGAAYVVPAVDPRSGARVPYRLDPFIPMISFADRASPTPPLIPLAMADSTVCINVLAPSDARRDLGCAEVDQLMHRTPSTRSGLELNLNSEQSKEPLELHIRSDQFLVTFDENGRHEISLSANMTDIWGNAYTTASTFTVWVAEPIDIEFGVLPGTPLAVGDAFNPALQLVPGVPANIDLTITHYPYSDLNQREIYTITGQANGFGYFPSSTPPVITDPGEYRVDLLVDYQDPLTGDWLMTAATWGGVVMSEPGDHDLIAHGRRGFDSLQDVPNQWFINCVTEPPSPTGQTAHMFNPYFNGDILWGRAEPASYDVWGLSCDGESIRLVASLQDTVGTLEALILARAARMDVPNRLIFESNIDLTKRTAADELPVFSSTYNGYPPAMAPGEIDQLAYYYLSSQRPGVRVREGVAEEGPTLSGGYWRLDTLYDDQLGVGYLGDLPNDIKFQYIGVVYQDLENEVNEYVGHGSSWVHIDDSDPTGTRVMPPFSGPGNGGWTTQGGPPMTLSGDPVHMVILPTGGKPGSVLEIGDHFHFAGHLMPTLDSQVQAIVTSPSGVSHTVSGRANQVGYFYDQGDDFPITEAGRWTVDVIVWHDGTIGTGDMVNCNPADPFNPALPCPSGDILGSENGRFEFYVVPAGTPRLGVTNPVPGFLHFDYDVPAIAINGNVPAGLSDVAVRYDIRMPGFLLESGSAVVTGDQFSFNFDPTTLANDFPNLDLVSREDWTAGLSDTFSITVFLEGTDSDGSTAQRVGVITIQGDRVYVDTLRVFPRVHLPLISR